MTSDFPLSPVTGHTDAAFAPVRQAFTAMLAHDPTFSAQLAVIWRGRSVIDLTGGPELSGDSLTGVFSVSKGISAIVIGLLIDRGLLTLDEPIGTYWPEFATAGKERVTVRQALSHRAGVLGVDETLPVADLIDSSRAAAALASTTPAWDPGSAHGYHAITIGVLMEELARRVTGRTLQSIYETDVRAPRDLDFYLGLPLAAESRYRAVASPTAQPEQTQSAPTSTDGIQSLAFNALHSQLDLATGPVSPNNLAVRAAGVAAVGGVGSARGLAGVYAATLDRADPLLSNRTIDEMSREHSFGLDRVLGFTTSFGVAFMKAHPQMDFASYRAFGHDGAGGALGFADPLHELAFGYIPHPMQPPGGADPKAIALSQLVRRIIRAQADASHLTPAT